MIADLLRSLADGIVSPRASARRILSGDHGTETVILLATLGFALGRIVSIILGGLFGANDPRGAMQRLLQDVVELPFSILSVFIFGYIILGAGRLFGGTGTRAQAFVVSAWYALVSSVLNPFALLGLGMMAADSSAAFGAALASLAGLYSTWLLACYVTELHGFRSAGAVFAVIIGVSAVLGFLVVSLLTAGPN